MPTSVGKRVLMCLITFRQQSGWCSEKSGALQKGWDEKLWSKWKKMCLYDFMHAVSLVLFSWDLILWHWKWHSILFDWNWNLKTWSFLFDVLGWMIFVNAIVTISLHACCHMVSLGAPWLSMMCGVGIYLPSISTSAAGLTTSHFSWKQKRQDEPVGLLQPLSKGKDTETDGRESRGQSP